MEVHILGGTTLKHYGVKGMKWGVRKDRRYSDRDEIIEKGRKVYRATTTKNESNEGFTYALSKKSEVKRYVDWIKSFSDKNTKVFSIDIPVTKTLIGPSEKKRVDAIIDIYKDEKLRNLAAKKIHSIYNATPYKVIKDDINNAASGRVSRTAQEQFSLILVGQDEIRSKYFNRFSEMGYSMVADDNDRLSGMSTSAILIFDRNKNLGNVN